MSISTDPTAPITLKLYVELYVKTDNLLLKANHNLKYNHGFDHVILYIYDSIIAHGSMIAIQQVFAKCIQFLQVANPK